jgi:hypothetical protein
MRHEILLQLGEPAAGRRFEQRDLRGYDRRVNCSRFVKNVSTAAVPIVLLSGTALAMTIATMKAITLSGGH